jgi:uncharacterized phage infection (PIP) family protein YhgE
MDDEQTPSATPGPDPDSLYTVENSIHTRNQTLADIKQKIKEVNEMLRSYLEGNEEYVEATKEAKEAGAKKSAVKQRLMGEPGAQGLPEKLNELKDQKHELEEGLSYYLTQYQQLTGTSQFEDENGDLREIVYVAKLVKPRRD